MNIGMLWFDNDPKTEVSAKIARAASYYRDKYGKTPNLCFVHPSMLGATPQGNGNGSFKGGPIEVRTSPTIRPNHFWIGVDGTIKPSES
jgi:hypothetical protein